MASLDVIIKQMILSAFRSAMMTSASPGHVNRFIGIESQGGMDIIGNNEEINAAIRLAVDDITSDPDSAESLADNLLNAEENTGKKKKTSSLEKSTIGGISKVISAANNPASIVAAGLSYLPHAALVAFAISITPFIFDILTKPGGPLDLRFKRVISDEVNAFLSRQTQRDTEIGVRQVVIQSKTGYTASNGANNYNTLRGIREGGIDKERLDRIGKVDHAKGVFDLG